MLRLVTLLLCVILPNLIFGQIPEDRLANWKNAGSNSQKNFKTVFIDEELLASSNSVNELIDKIISENQNVDLKIKFPEGQFFFDKTINLPSNVTIQGNLADLTEFIFDLGGSGDLIRVSGSINKETYLLTETAERKTKNIKVSNHDLEVSDWIILKMDDEDLVTSDWAIGSVSQIAQIEAVASNEIILKDDLRIDFPLSRNPFIQKIDPAENTFIKCIKILRLDDTKPQQTSNVNFTYAVNCGVENVESENCNFSHIEANYSSNIIVKNSYLHDGFDHGNGGRAYGVALQFGTGNCLVENNIFSDLRHSMLLQAGANGNVFAYNYSRDTYWEGTALPQNSAGDAVLHGNYVFANLFEGNICQNIVIDNSHGPNGPYNTFFRNRAELWGIFFSSDNSPSQNFIANEIPNSGFPYNIVNYTIQGEDQLEIANNNKGDFVGDIPSELPLESLYYDESPSFLNGNQFGGIGFPNDLNENSISAKENYSNNNFFGDCDINANNILDKTQELKIFPNPASDFLSLSVLDKNKDIRIIDNYGNEVLTAKLSQQNSTLNIRNLKNGVYFINYDSQLYKFAVIK